MRFVWLLFFLFVDFRADDLWGAERSVAGCPEQEQGWAAFLINDLQQMQTECLFVSDGAVHLRYALYDDTHDPVHWIDYRIGIYLVHEGLSTPHVFFRGESTRDTIDAQYNLRNELFRASYVITEWCKAAAKYGVDDEL